MTINKLDHNCRVGKETTPQKFTFMTWLLEIPMLPAKTQIWVNKNSGCNLEH
jgi:hypothetical protein